MSKNRMNIHQVSGTIVNVPELKTVKDDKKVLNFRLMYITPQATDADGSHVNFIDVDAWGKVAEIFHPLLTKDMRLIVYGELVQRRWKSKEGGNRERFSISAEAITISDLKFKPLQQAA